MAGTTTTTKAIMRFFGVSQKSDVGKNYTHTFLAKESSEIVRTILGKVLLLAKTVRSVIFIWIILTAVFQL